MKIKEHCVGCKYEYDCDFAHNINFCENCKDFDRCSIRYVYCKAGHELECNNGFEEKDDLMF